MSRLRLGVVLIVAGAAGHEIDGVRRAIGDGALDRIAPHITLVPPVNVNESHMPAALEVLRAAAATSWPLRLDLGPPTTFWPDTPVLYLEVGGDLPALHQLRDQVFRGPFHRPLTWPFVPHVTLAEEVAPTRLTVLVEELHGFRMSAAIERIHLLAEREGRRWEPIADVELGPAVVIGRGGLEVTLHTSLGLDPEGQAFLAAVVEAQPDAGQGEPFAVTARREGEVVGVASGHINGDLCLEQIVVAGANRAQGIGRHLLGAVEGLGRDRRCRRAVLVCRRTGQPWWADRGWTVVQDLPAWHAGVDYVRVAKVL